MVSVDLDKLIYYLLVAGEFEVIQCGVEGVAVIAGGELCPNGVENRCRRRVAGFGTKIATYGLKAAAAVIDFLI